VAQLVLGLGRNVFLQVQSTIMPVLLWLNGLVTLSDLFVCLRNESWCLSNSRVVINTAADQLLNILTDGKIQLPPAILLQQVRFDCTHDFVPFVHHVDMENMFR
jgi:hypothetical protein